MQDLHRYLKQGSFESFHMDVSEKLIRGVTTIDEVLRVLPHSTFYQ
jgi:type II secretory ATPase GspE/PulE/Tfp pilus assembly ATPase PilB-like protein